MKVICRLQVRSKQENILSSSTNSLHDLNISVYCAVSLVCVCVCLCVGGWEIGRVGREL